MACPGSFDWYRSKTEDLGPRIYARAMGRSWWHSFLKRGEWPVGRGFSASTFEVARSAPGLQETPWQAVKSINADSNPKGACNLQFTNALIGTLERQYKPEMLGIRGPVVCKKDLTTYWNSKEFWVKGFQRLEQITSLEITNRHQTVYDSYVMRYGFVGGALLTAEGKSATQPVPANNDLSDYLPGGAIGLPDSELTYEQLEYLSENLITEGAHEAEVGSASRWITLGDDGPVFPIDIGMMAWRKLKVNNPEYRADSNAAFQGWGKTAPTLQRIGASGVMYNFRGVVNPFPARYLYVPNGCTVNFCVTPGGTVVSTFTNTAGSGTLQVAAGYPGTTVGQLVPGAPLGCGHIAYTDINGNAQAASPYGGGADIIIRVPSYCPSTDSGDATKGVAAVVNKVWRDALPSGTSGASAANIVKLESARVLNPLVMEEEVMIPVDAAPGMKWDKDNYYGMWDFIYGNDAFLGMDGCTGLPLPFKDMGRHFCQFDHAYKPVAPQYGAFLLFRQCPNSISRVLCGS